MEKDIKNTITDIKQSIRHLATLGVPTKQLIDATKAIEEEIVESEDERIRKTLIAVVNLYYGEGEDEEKTACLYWLEKQGEHKKFRDSIQVGDKVTRNEDGELVNLSQLNRVAKKQGEQKPIGKPTLDVEIPFGMDSELVEETMTIPKGCYAVIEDNKVVIRKGEKSAEWSEEDRKMMRNIIDDIHCGTNFNPKVMHAANEREKWFKSICMRYQSKWKPSEEQITVINDTIRFIEDKSDSLSSDYLYNKMKELLEQLKAL